MVRTLDGHLHLAHLGAHPVQCAEIRLEPMHDHTPPLFVGRSHIEIAASSSMSFVVHATAPNPHAAALCIMKSDADPYDASTAFRFIAEDYDGRTWNGGYTRPHLVRQQDASWLLSGKLETLTTSLSGDAVSEQPGVEIIYAPAPRIPTSNRLVTVASIAGRTLLETEGPGSHELEVLGSRITFEHRPGSSDELWVTATASSAINHPHMDGWLTEPLRIMLGQPIAPRVVVRNYGGRQAALTLLEVPEHHPEVGLAALYGWNRQAATDQAFWKLYADILTTLATDRDEREHCHFEANPLTARYDEIRQASRGSRWVMALTLASAVEGLVDLLKRPDEPDPAYAQAELGAMKEHLEAWKGSERLRSRMLGNLRMVGSLSPQGYLKRMQTEGKFTSDRIKAWTAVRNAVMHGRLVSPFSTKEEDQQLLLIADLFHTLAREVIARGVARVACPTSMTGEPAPG